MVEPKDSPRTLEEYRAKRHFESTPEPKGEQSKSVGEKLTFCVQKHLASHLHYDFRLEHRGVLLSWAVPKGPSLNPSDKRLAMMTENHPLEYGRFEGVIPEGYGAGIVMLWDSGIWQPEPESADVDAAMAKGEMKFTLDGYKLKGSWVLVRTGGYGKGQAGRSWLLIKHRDFWSGEIDIASAAPRSIVSDFDFAEILAQESPELWKSDRPVKGGATGHLLREIIEQAAQIRARREQETQ